MSDGHKPHGESAEPAVSPPPGNPRFPTVDGLRAIAALSVLLFHAGLLSGANQAWYGSVVEQLNIGVAIFFAISGFLLYRPLFAANYAKAPQIRPGEFLWRRGVRIVPAYWFALTILAIYPGLVGVFTGDWWIYYFFLQIYQTDTRVAGIPVAWSLCAEVVFYLLLPFYALAMRNICKTRARGRTIAIELSALALLWVIAFTARMLMLGDHYSLVFMPAVLGWFLPGMALAIASVVLSERQQNWAPVSLIRRYPALPWLGAGACFALLVLVGPQSKDASTATVITSYLLSPMVAVLILLPAIRGGGSVVHRFLTLPVLAWLGLISYGIFLWHLTPMTWLIKQGIFEWFPGPRFLSLTLLSATIAIGFATFSYYIVERPILRLKNRPRRARRRSGSPTLGPTREEPLIEKPEVH